MHGTLHFLYLSHLLYGICVKIFIMNRYISKSYTRSKNTIYRAGAAVVSTITSYRLLTENGEIYRGISLNPDSKECLKFRPGNLNLTVVFLVILACEN